MKRILFTLFALLLTLVFATAFPVFAQDTPVPDTAVPTIATQEASTTAEPLETQQVMVVVTPTPGIDATAVPTEEATDTAGDEKAVVPVTGSGAILLIIMAVLASLAAGGGVVAIIGRYRKNPEGIRALEIVGDSVPKEHADKLIVLIDALVAVLSTGREALDHVAADSKPQQSGLSAYSIEQLMTEVNLRQTQAGASGFFTDVTPPIERFSTDELSAELRRRIPPTASVDFNPPSVEG